MKKIPILTLLLASVFSLAACNSQPQASGEGETGVSEQKLAELQEKLNTVEASLKAADAALTNSLQEALTTVRGEVDTAKAQLKEELLGKVNQETQKLTDALAKEVGDLNTKLAQDKAELAEDVEDLNEGLYELAQVVTEFGDQLELSHDSLEADIDAVRETLDHYDDADEKLAADIEALQGRLTQVEAKLADIDALDTRVKALEEGGAALQQSLTQLQATVAAAVEAGATKAQLDAAVAQVTTAITALQGADAQLQANLTALQATAATAAQVQQLSDDVDAKMAALLVGTWTDANRESTVKKSIEDLESSVTALGGRVDALETFKAEVIASYATKAEVQEVKDSLDALATKEEADALDARLTAIEASSGGLGTAWEAFNGEEAQAAKAEYVAELAHEYTAFDGRIADTFAAYEQSLKDANLWTQAAQEQLAAARLSVVDSHGRAMLEYLFKGTTLITLADTKDEAAAVRDEYVQVMENYLNVAEFATRKIVAANIVSNVDIDGLEDDIVDAIDAVEYDGDEAQEIFEEEGADGVKAYFDEKVAELQLWQHRAEALNVVYKGYTKDEVLHKGYDGDKADLNVAALAEVQESLETALKVQKHTDEEYLAAEGTQEELLAMAKEDVDKMAVVVRGLGYATSKAHAAAQKAAAVEKYDAAYALLTALGDGKDLATAAKDALIGDAKQLDGDVSALDDYLACEDGDAVVALLAADDAQFALHVNAFDAYLETLKKVYGAESEAVTVNGLTLKAGDNALYLDDIDDLMEEDYSAAEDADEYKAMAALQLASVKFVRYQAQQLAASKAYADSKAGAVTVDSIAQLITGVPSRANYNEPFALEQNEEVLEATVRLNLQADAVLTLDKAIVDTYVAEYGSYDDLRTYVSDKEDAIDLLTNHAAFDAKFDETVEALLVSGNYAAAIERDADLDALKAAAAARLVDDKKVVNLHVAQATAYDEMLTAVASSQGQIALLKGDADGKFLTNDDVLAFQKLAADSVVLGNYIKAFEYDAETFADDLDAANTAIGTQKGAAALAKEDGTGDLEALAIAVYKATGYNAAKVNIEATRAVLTAYADTYQTERQLLLGKLVEATRDAYVNAVKVEGKSFREHIDSLAEANNVLMGVYEQRMATYKTLYDYVATEVGVIDALTNLSDAEKTEFKDMFNKIGEGATVDNAFLAKYDSIEDVAGDEATVDSIKDWYSETAKPAIDLAVARATQYDAIVAYKSSKLLLVDAVNVGYEQLTQGNEGELATVNAKITAAVKKSEFKSAVSAEEALSYYNAQKAAIDMTLAQAANYNLAVVHRSEKQGQVYSGNADFNKFIDDENGNHAADINTTRAEMAKHVKLSEFLAAQDNGDALLETVNGKVDTVFDQAKVFNEVLKYAATQMAAVAGLTRLEVEEKTIDRNKIMAIPSIATYFQGATVSHANTKLATDKNNIDIIYNHSYTVQRLRTRVAQSISALEGVASLPVAQMNFIRGKMEGYNAFDFALPEGVDEPSVAAYNTVYANAESQLGVWNDFATKEANLATQINDKKSSVNNAANFDYEGLGVDQDDAPAAKALLIARLEAIAVDYSLIDLAGQKFNVETTKEAVLRANEANMAIYEQVTQYIL